MENIRLCDPSDPGTVIRRTGKHKVHSSEAKRKSMSGGIVASILATVIILFSMGFFPQVNNYFSSLNDQFASHNDEIVASVIQYFPAALCILAGAGLLFLLINKFNQAANKRRPA